MRLVSLCSACAVTHRVSSPAPRFPSTRAGSEPSPPGRGPPRALLQLKTGPDPWGQTGRKQLSAADAEVKGQGWGRKMRRESARIRDEAPEPPFPELGGRDAKATWTRSPGRCPGLSASSLWARPHPARPAGVQTGAGHQEAALPIQTRPREGASLRRRAGCAACGAPCEQFRQQVGDSRGLNQALG